MGRTIRRREDSDRIRGYPEPFRVRRRFLSPAIRGRPSPSSTAESGRAAGGPGVNCRVKDTRQTNQSTGTTHDRPDDAPTGGPAETRHDSPVTGSIRFAVGRCALGGLLVARQRPRPVRDSPRRRSRRADRRPPAPVSRRPGWPRGPGRGGDAGPRGDLGGESGRRARPAARSPGHRLQAARSGRRCATSRPARPRATPRSPGGSARRVRPRGGAGLRRQHAGGGRSVPPRGARRRPPVGLSLGRRAEAGAAGREAARERPARVAQPRHGRRRGLGSRGPRSRRVRLRGAPAPAAARRNAGRWPRSTRTSAGSAAGS